MLPIHPKNNDNPINGFCQAGHFCISKKFLFLLVFLFVTHSAIPNRYRLSKLRVQRWSKSIDLKRIEIRRKMTVMVLHLDSTSFIFCFLSNPKLMLHVSAVREKWFRTQTIAFLLPVSNPIFFFGIGADIHDPKNVQENILENILIAKHLSDDEILFACTLID